MIPPDKHMTRFMIHILEIQNCLQHDSNTYFYVKKKSHKVIHDSNLTPHSSIHYPRLSWRDMQHIVLLTANPKPLLGEPGWLANGVGRQYSLKFGYGLMDADAMVELAQVWPGAGKQGSYSVLPRLPNRSLAMFFKILFSS